MAPPCSKHNISEDEFLGRLWPSLRAGQGRSSFKSSLSYKVFSQPVSSLRRLPYRVVMNVEEETVSAMLSSLEERWDLPAGGFWRPFGWSLFKTGSWTRWPPFWFDPAELFLWLTFSPDFSHRLGVPLSQSLPWSEKSLKRKASFQIKWNTFLQEISKDSLTQKLS